MKLKIAENDIVKFIKDICFVHFLPLMKKKNIDIRFHTNRDSLPACFDSDKIDKIIFNLLSNAYKYTPPGGFIEVELTEYKKDGHTYLTIQVRDSGIGISTEDQQKIFMRFYTNNNIAGAGESNGIGLSLTKDLVEIHQGTIGVSSVLGEGTVFSVTIPVDRQSYNNPDIEYSQAIISDEKIPDVMAIGNIGKEDSGKDFRKNNITILLVEDNTELLSLMKNILSRHFRVESATNGVEALKLTQEKEIDIIISDVMMPQMNGIELCRTLKKELETSHIPIILLTAKNSIDDRIECYNAGADGYISKPFELKLLVARINNFVQNRKQKQKDFKTSFEINISTLEQPPINGQFLEDVVGIIECHISEPEFDVTLLAKKLNMSRSSLYRKVKSLTDLTPGDFIRNIRLKHACAILRSKSADSISEIAYQTGFSDPKYFSTCFKNEFGITPSEYRNEYSG